MVTLQKIPASCRHQDIIGIWGVLWTGLVRVKDLV